MNKQVQKLLETFDDSKRGLAKLLARENITVQIVTGAPTASFDPVSRVLTIPNWPGLTLDQTDLLLGHEVGHALFTNTSYIAKVVKKPGLMSYWNVIEDTRIERKMKEGYPGLKRVFYNGYEQFHSKGPLFRGTTSGIYFDDPLTGRETLKRFADMKFIDRINAFYKIGAFVDIPFSADELTWLERINRCSSTEDAMVIAEALYQDQKEKNQQEKEENGDGQSKKQKQDKNAKKEKSQKSQSAEDGESDESDDADGDDEEDGKASSSQCGDDDESEENDSDSSDEDGDGDASGDDDDADSDEDGDDEDGETGPKSNQVDFPDETDPTASTDKQIADALKKLADKQDTRVNVRHILLKPLPDSMVKARTVTAADWSTKTLESLGVHTSDMEKVLLLLEQKWNAQYLNTAKHMALEFDRRKTAKTLSNAKIAKTGRLNMNKLAMHKFTEDLFLRTLNVPHGKSHGIVMTIDASGSMTHVFPHVLDQVLLFAVFAHQCQIPFEAYMFTDTSHPAFTYEHEAKSLGPLTLTPSGAGRLVGLINTMDRRSFKNQIKCVLALRAHYAPDAEVVRNYPTANAKIGKNDSYYGGASGVIPFARLGGTPLYTGLLIAERHVERMKRTLKLDKMTNVLITDGEDTNGVVYQTQDINMSRNNRGSIYDRFERYDSTGLVVRDTVTKKNHVLVNTTGSGMNCPDNAMLTLLFDVMKSRHEARNIMLFLADSTSPATAIHRSLSFLTRANAEPNVSEQDVAKQLREKHQFVMPTNTGAAELTLAVPPTELRLSENDFANSNTNGKTANQVTKAFTEASVRAISNRVFVNTVMPFLA
jgi:hypothetical protein